MGKNEGEKKVLKTTSSLCFQCHIGVLLWCLNVLWGAWVVWRRVPGVGQTKAERRYIVMTEENHWDPTATRKGIVVVSFDYGLDTTWNHLWALSVWDCLLSWLVLENPAHCGRYHSLSYVRRVCVHSLLSAAECVILGSCCYVFSKEMNYSLDL